MKKVLGMLVLSVLMIGCSDDRKPCAVDILDSQRVDLRTAMTPAFPVYATDLDLQETYDSSAQLYYSEINNASDDGSVSAMEIFANATDLNKQVHIQITFENKTHAIKKVALNMDYPNNDTEWFSCLEEACAGIVIDDVQNTFLFQAVPLTEEGGARLEKISGKFYWHDESDFEGQMPHALAGGC